MIGNNIGCYAIHPGQRVIRRLKFIFMLDQAQDDISIDIIYIYQWYATFYVGAQPVLK